MPRGKHACLCRGPIFHGKSPSNPTFNMSFPWHGSTFFLPACISPFISIVRIDRIDWSPVEIWHDPKSRACCSCGGGKKTHSSFSIFWKQIWLMRRTDKSLSSAWTRHTFWVQKERKKATRLLFSNWNCFPDAKYLFYSSVYAIA